MKKTTIFKSIFITALFLVFGITSMSAAEDLIRYQSNNSIKSQKTSSEKVALPVMIRQYNAPQITYLPDNGNANIAIDGLERSDSTGEPRLPFEPVRILLPPHIDSIEKVTIRIQGNGKQSFAIPSRIQPGAKTKIITDPTLCPPVYQETIYSSAAAWPTSLDEAASPVIQKACGVNILCITIMPVVYYPASNLIESYSTVSVSISIDKPSPAASRISADDTPFRNTPEDIEMIESLVINPEALTEYRTEMNEVTASALSSANYPFVIITKNAWKSYFQPLVNKRNSQGLRTAIYTTESIAANYTDDGLSYYEAWESASAKALSVKTRKFIADAYAKWGTKYVLLGGDTQIIPAFRVVNNVGLGKTWVPTDMYYGGLNGNWRLSGNYQATDPVMEVYIGRAPVNSTTQITTFVNKTLGFNTGARKILLAGEYLNPNFADSALNSIYSYIIAKNPSYSRARIYDCAVGSAMYCWSANSILNGLNSVNFGWVNGLNSNNYHVVFHFGHSNPNHNMRLEPTHIASMKNSRPYFVYSLGCYGGAFDGWDRNHGTSSDGDCMGERFIANTTKGVSAYIGHSREGLGGVTQSFAYYFAQYFCEQKPIGKLFHDSRTKLLSANIQNAAYAWAGFSLNLLGDPTMVFGPTQTIASTYIPKASAASVISLAPMPTSTPPVVATVTPSTTLTPNPMDSTTPTTTPTCQLTSTPTSTATRRIIALAKDQIMAYPNPAKGRMTFMLDLENDATVRIDIFDMAGNKVSEITEQKSSGTNVVVPWNCSSIAPGIYLAKTVVNGKIINTRKIAIIR